MLKLLKDKQNEFSCELQIEGASSSASVARLYFENSGYELVFQGKIQNNTCVIPIGKASLLHLPDSGNLRLEVVVDDTVFTPYESRYEVEQSKSVKLVEVTNKQTNSNVTVSVKPQPSQPSPLKKLEEMLTAKGFDGSAKSLSKLVQHREVKKTILEFCNQHNLNLKTVVSKLIA